MKFMTFSSSVLLVLAVSLGLRKCLVVQAAPMHHPTLTRHRIRHEAQRKQDMNRTRGTHPLDSMRQPSTEFKPIFLSDFVALSPTVPRVPPWQIIEDSTRDDKEREKRSPDFISDHVSFPACQSVSGWVERSKADDMWGNTVDIAQDLDIGGTLVNQYFYETYCNQEKHQCRGTDKNKYRSECQSKYIWAYAKIIDSAGQEGWNFIKIRGSCNCALYFLHGKTEGFLGGIS